MEVPLQRFLDFGQRLGHPQARRMQRPALVVVEDATHRRTVVQDHIRCCVGNRCRRRRHVGRVPRVSGWCRALLRRLEAAERRIVEGLGGTIAVSSSIDPRGHGTEIRIDLPA